MKTASVICDIELKNVIGTYLKYLLTYSMEQSPS